MWRSIASRQGAALYAQTASFPRYCCQKHRVSRPRTSQVPPPEPHLTAQNPSREHADHATSAAAQTKITILWALSSRLILAKPAELTSLTSCENARADRSGAAGVDVTDMLLARNHDAHRMHVCSARVVLVLATTRRARLAAAAIFRIAPAR